MKHSGRIIRTHSLRRRLVFWIVILLLPLLILLLVCTTVIRKSFEQQMEAYVQQMVSPFTAEIDTLLTATRRFIAEQKFDLSAMEPPVNPEEELKYIQKTQAIGNEISDSLAAYPNIDAIFLYNGTDLWFIHNYNRSYVVNRNAASWLEEYLSEYPQDALIFQEGYLSFSVNDTGWLFTAMNVENGMIGCWFQDASLLQALEEAELPGFEGALLENASGEPLNAALAGKQKDWEEEFFVTEQTLPSVPMILTAYWDRDIIFAVLHDVVHIVTICLCVIYALYIGFMIFIRKSVIRPLDRLVEVIHGMKKRNFAEISIGRKDPEEVQDVFYALNGMIREVKDLKIRVYEEQIIKQNTQLQLYQLQLKPHFFLNAFNNIVSFARLSDYAMVQKLTLFLASHCRYVLYNTHFVTVEEELEYTKNYIDIQKIQHSSCTGLQYRTDISEEILDYKVPILCIQIFVENALKYARNRETEPPVEISVSADFCSEGEERKVCITIDDSGDGFPEEVLSALSKNCEKPSYATSDHGVGIANVCQRLNLLYHGKASVVFANNAAGGAHVALYFPARIGEEE